MMNIKEAVEHCYDSEELFEFGQQYIDPMDNNGEIMMDMVDKKKARREAKKHIENELQDQV